MGGDGGEHRTAEGGRVGAGRCRDLGGHGKRIGMVVARVVHRLRAHGGNEPHFSPACAADRPGLSHRVRNAGGDRDRGGPPAGRRRFCLCSPIRGGRNSRAARRSATTGGASRATRSARCPWCLRGCRENCFSTASSPAPPRAGGTTAPASAPRKKGVLARGRVQTHATGSWPCWRRIARAVSASSSSTCRRTVVALAKR